MVSSFSSTFRRHLIGVLLMRRNYFVVQWLDFQIIWFIIFRSTHHCYVMPYSGKVLVNTGSGYDMSPDGTEPQPDPTLTIDLRYPNMILENTWHISDKHLFSRTLSHIPEVGVLMRHFPEITDGCLVSDPLVNPDTPINALSSLIRSKPRNQLAVWARLRRARQEWPDRHSRLNYIQHHISLMWCCYILMSCWINYALSEFQFR